MGSSIFGVGISGLNAANLGLGTTGHNIANVNTEGYSRQFIKQSAPMAQNSGSGFAGLGVQVDSVERKFDEYLNRQLQSTQARTSYVENYLSHLQEIDNVVADSSAGISPAMQDYFAEVQNVATSPSNLPARSALIASAQTLINRFQSFETRLSDQRDAVNGEIINATSSINTIAAQIASINLQISAAKSSGQPPNDLLDQRDQMIRDLNALVRATPVAQYDGTYNVFIGSGQNLVVGGTPFTLDAVASNSDPQRMTVIYNQNGKKVYLPETAFDGGSLGGVLRYRSEALDPAQNSLAKVAMGMVQAFNAQHKAGMDMDGNLGQNFFTYPRANNVDYSNQFGGANFNITAQATAVPISDFALNFDGADYSITRLSDNVTVNATAAQIAAGFTTMGVTVQQTGGAAVTPGSMGFNFPPSIGRINPNALNTGAGVLSGYISDVKQLQDSDYEMNYDGSNYVLTRAFDNQQTVITAASAAAGPVTVDGMTFNISGAWVAGDKETIQPYKSFINGLSVRITDPRQVAAAGPMRVTTNASNTGNARAEQPIVDSPIGNPTTQSSVNPAVRNSVTIQFTSGTTFNATDNVTGVVTANAYVAGMSFSMNGWSMKIDGTPVNGDVFNVGVNLAGSEDGRNALALGQLQTTKLLSNGRATLQDSYAQMVAQIGTKTNEANIMSQAQSTLLDEAEASRNAVAGVNLDEEAANLLRYQQAYMAASKLIQIAQKVFEEIVSLGR